MKIGDGGACSGSNRYWQVPLSSYTPFWGLNTAGQMVVSEDGITSYVISAGGSGVAAGDGIAITGGVLSVDLLSSAGLRISGGNLAVKPDFDTLKLTSASELYFDKSVANSWTGVQTFKNSCVFQSSGTAIFNGEVKTSALSCYQGMMVSGAFSVSSIYFADGTDLQTAEKLSYYANSNNLKVASTAEKSFSTANESTHTKLKEIQILWGGTGKGVLSVSCNMKSVSASEFVYGFIYKNGVQVIDLGSVGGNSYQTKGVAILSAEAHDLIQLYGSSRNYTAYVSGFGLYWDKTSYSNEYEVILN
jgi:hypothetical protein